MSDLTSALTRAGFIPHAPRSSATEAALRAKISRWESFLAEQPADGYILMADLQAAYDRIFKPQLTGSKVGSP